MTIDDEIKQAVQKIRGEDPLKRANALSIVGTVNFMKSKIEREKKLREASLLQERDYELFNQMETEACEHLLGTPSTLWWIENVLLPLTEMPDDSGQVTLSEGTRRKQIEAQAYSKLLNMIYSKGKRE